MWSLDERKRMVARPMTNVFPSGHKEVFKVRLASGREVEATANHPFMTFDGWTSVGGVDGRCPGGGAAAGAGAGADAAACMTPKSSCWRT